MVPIERYTYGELIQHGTVLQMAGSNTVFAMGGLVYKAESTMYVCRDLILKFIEQLKAVDFTEAVCNLHDWYKSGQYFITVWQSLHRVELPKFNGETITSYFANMRTFDSICEEAHRWTGEQYKVLETIIAAMEKLEIEVFDFHDGNIMVDNHGNYRIIDFLDDIYYTNTHDMAVYHPY